MSDRRADIMYQMRKNLADGIHTMNACKCGLSKRGGTEACVCCLADMLRGTYFVGSKPKNICQCRAGYAQGECEKHGTPIIHTITDDAFCPICRIAELEATIAELTKTVKQGNDMIQERS